jgi:hypothetical protein
VPGLKEMMDKKVQKKEIQIGFKTDYSHYLGIVNAAIRVCVHLQFLLTLSSTWMVLTHCSNGCIVKLGTFHCLQDNEQQEKSLHVQKPNFAKLHAQGM